MLLALVPTLLVMAQPDLGTSIVYVTIALALLFVAGTRWTHFAALGGLAVAAVALAFVIAPAAGVPLLKDYQQDRLTAFLEKDNADPASQGYQLNQAETAIGSGRKTGRGTERATQTRLDFLPESRTDFVFAAVGELYGFVGAGIVLSLYALLIWRSLRILTIAKNLYGALLAAGVGAMLMTQVFVNVGGNVGIMPITGIPLPLMSYGGSSVIVTLIALGILQSVYVQAKEAAASQTRGARVIALAHVTRESKFFIRRFMRKQVLVSVDRGETRVAILESKKAAGRTRRQQAKPSKGVPEGRPGLARRRALHRAPRPPLDRRQRLQGPSRQRAGRHGGRVRRHRPREERLPPRRRDRHAGRRRPSAAGAAGAGAGRGSPTC